MIKQGPLLEEMEMDVEEVIQRYKNGGGSPENAIAWFANYLAHMIKARPQELRDEIKSVVHQRICEMD